MSARTAATMPKTPDCKLAINTVAVALLVRNITKGMELLLLLFVAMITAAQLLTLVAIEAC